MTERGQTCNAGRLWPHVRVQSIQQHVYRKKGHRAGHECHTGAAMCGRCGAAGLSRTRRDKALLRTLTEAHPGWRHTDQTAGHMMVILWQPRSCTQLLPWSTPAAVLTLLCRSADEGGRRGRGLRCEAGGARGACRTAGGEGGWAVGADRGECEAQVEVTDTTRGYRRGCCAGARGNMYPVNARRG